MSGPGVGPVPIDQAFLARDALEVAPELLGLLLIDDAGRTARIVEVEAYRGGDDPGSHAYRGQTARTVTMFGPAGFLYVYFTYGMHWCANVVCGSAGVASAVLLRAADPLLGLELMRQARWRTQRIQRDLDLCRGPARLCQAFGIDGTYDGVELLRPHGRLWLADDGQGPGGPVRTSTRIGLSAGAELPWRFFVGGSRAVSGPLRRPPGGASKITPSC